MKVISGKNYLGEDCNMYVNENLAKELNYVKMRVLKRNWDYVCLICGLPGCLTGDTMIRTNRASLGRKHNLKWMYSQYHNESKKPRNFIQWDLKIPTYVRSFDGNIIRLNKIKDVVYSGKKKVYKLILADGEELKATHEHKIMTNNGFIELRNLNIGKDLVMCDTPKAFSKGIKQPKLKDVDISGLIYHPYKRSRNRVSIHRIIYEAHQNNLSLEDYIRIVSMDKEKSKGLKFIPRGYEIHHKDFNHYNNALENLECLTIYEHKKKHHHYKNFNQGIPVYKKIKEIKYEGIEDTYDIQCEEPNHNFVANGIVVHNSGKSTFARTIAKYCDPNFTIDNIAFSSNEFIKITESAKKGSAIILDESFQSLNTRITMTPSFLRILNHLNVVRSRNLFIILCLPNFFDLSKAIALFRSSHLFVTYAQKTGERGHFSAYGRDKKQNLYIKGLKFMNYRCEKANFYGRFTRNRDIVDEGLYDTKKIERLKGEFLNKADTETQETTGLILLRARIFYLMHKNFDLTYREIGTVFKMAPDSIKGAIDGLDTHRVSFALERKLDKLCPMPLTVAKKQEE